MRRPILPPKPPSPSPRKAKRSAAEWASIRRDVTELTLQGLTVSQVHRALRAKYGVSYGKVQEIVTELKGDWQEGQETLGERRERQLKRVEYRMGQIASRTRPMLDEFGEEVFDSRGRKIMIPDLDKISWSQLARFEQLWSSIAGTNQPIEVKHSGSVGVAVAGIISTLTEEEAQKLVQDQLDVERKAALAEKYGITSEKASLALVK